MFEITTLQNQRVRCRECGTSFSKGDEEKCPYCESTNFINYGVGDQHIAYPSYTNVRMIYQRDRLRLTVFKFVGHIGKGNLTNEYTLVEHFLKGHEIEYEETYNRGGFAFFDINTDKFRIIIWSGENAHSLRYHSKNGTYGELLMGSEEIEIISADGNFIKRMLTLQAKYAAVYRVSHSKATAA